MARGLGLTLDRGVVCDATLRAAPHVFAAGDVAAWPHPMAGGAHIRVEHWTNAAEHGTHAGRNALSDEPKPYTAVPYFWSDQYDVKIQAAGLPARAQRVELIEPDVAVGLERDDRVVSVVTFNAPRRLMHFRRRIGTLPRLDEILTRRMILVRQHGESGPPALLGEWLESPRRRLRSQATRAPTTRPTRRTSTRSPASAAGTPRRTRTWRRCRPRSS